MPRKMFKVELHLRNAVDAQLGVGGGGGGGGGRGPFFKKEKFAQILEKRP